jgi:hypothetical protein
LTRISPRSPLATPSVAGRPFIVFGGAADPLALLPPEPATANPAKPRLDEHARGVGSPRLAARVVLEAFCHAPKHLQRDPRRRLDDSSERAVADHEQPDR